MTADNTSVILLVEDNEQNRYLATFLLERSGYAVVSAADGPAALEIAAQGAVLCILLDIQLPTMDGYAVARHLRALEHHQRTPIIAVTSYAMAGDRDRALDSGCSGYLEKPINPETFVSEIERLMRNPERPS